jgi:hypothetical protein
MRAASFEDTDLTHLNRGDTVAAINRAYNYDTTRSYTDYRQKLDLLPDETLRSILRTVTLARKDKASNAFVRAFIARWKCAPESISRFAELAESEYFKTRDSCTKTYGVNPDNIGMGQAIAGVLTLEDATHQITVPQHYLVMILTVSGWLSNVGTLELANGGHGHYISINEDAFYRYLQTENTDEYHQRVIAALCSGQKYSRFLEVLETVNATTTKPLISGLL